MTKSTAEDRMLANEAVFRKHNEQVQKQLDKLRAMAEEDNQTDIVPDSDMSLRFVCECADENCKQRIPLKLSEYSDIHTNRRQFIVVHGHEAATIERVVEKVQHYTVVEKRETPPESASSLQLTPLKNV